jgi:hypothetical protein
LLCRAKTWPRLTRFFRNQMLLKSREAIGSPSRAHLFYCRSDFGVTEYLVFLRCGSYNAITIQVEYFWAPFESYQVTHAKYLFASCCCVHANQRYGPGRRSGAASAIRLAARRFTHVCHCQERAARRAQVARNPMAGGPARRSASGKGRKAAAVAVGLRGRSLGEMLRLRFRASCRPPVE